MTGDTAISVAGGSVRAGSLGRTLLHEHLIVTSPEVLAGWTSLLGPRDALIEQASDELAAIRAEHGIGAIVDVSTPDMGRDIGFIEEVSARSKVAVVVATGSWLRPPRSFTERSDGQLAEHFIAEIRDGIEGGRSRAGVIKVASGESLDPLAMKIFRAAALAHLATGVPVIAHGEARTRQHPVIADALESLGISPGAVCLAHVHDAEDYGYLADLARRGYWLGLDRFPGAFRGGASPAQRIGQLQRLASDGYAPQLCVSHDWCTRTTLMSDAEERRYRGEYNPDGFSWCHRRLVPQLAARGLAGLEEQLFTDNPRRFLAPRRPGGATARLGRPPRPGC
jgi:phosphotriesterase-related protein